ncbi:cytochrome c biogenesis CcdA family protein [Albidovulum sp.]|uniref:cytochrome c biogenesis CcdA family protein n=1 Tax=Albidovulum sp. TaxID=1872424 RepID=UPI001DD25134|nr:cytochrome c biogenesis protein CcdA [Paracoccaceae bacterium]HPE27140.1 cytochrome c biogenesis protein CcdA [Albidovulum sp.]MCB2157091.1 cytochrome c biogenesis protein CcdA [Paracoccaceae bacterium]MCO5127587.1 cytochrome c biogenesis protein CcdA [Paracoccaceae bacterium]MCP5377069.1 cytochrome c biogenesis protein CcdA [Paracoccaceae bacterium]
MFDPSFLTGGFPLAAFVALLAGVLSFVSPCVLPVVPSYLAYMAGIGMGEMEGQARARRAALLAAVFFVLGLSTVFLLLGIAASALGRFLLQNQDWFSTGAGIVVMIFGAHFIGVFRIPFLDREARIDAGDRGGSAFGAYLLGLAFAFGWTPCIGPQLGMILTLAAEDASLPRGAALLAVYAFGLGIPFLLVAAFFPRLKGAMAFLKRHMARIEKIMGLLLWTIGLMMVTGSFSAFSYWLLETFPALGLVG